jgi:hypothetical protein
MSADTEQTSAFPRFATNLLDGTIALKTAPISVRREDIRSIEFNLADLPVVNGFSDLNFRVMSFAFAKQ